MSLTKEAQAKADRSFRRKEEQLRDGKLAMAEYEAAAVAMREKIARLRKLREAKEAQDAAEGRVPAEPVRARKSAGKSKPAKGEAPAGPATAEA